MKKSLKPLLWALALIASISLVVFSSDGCKSTVPPVEESEAEEQVGEEVTDKFEEKTLEEPEAEAAVEEKAVPSD